VSVTVQLLRTFFNSGPREASLYISWVPSRTDLSTNGTCQLERTENLASKGTRRERYTVRQQVTRRIEEKAKNRNTCQMFGITVRFRGDAMLSTKPTFEFELEVVAPQ